MAKKKKTASGGSRGGLGGASFNDAAPNSKTAPPEQGNSETEHKYKNRSDAVRAFAEAAHGVFEHFLVTSENYPNIVRVAAQHGEPHAIAIVSGIRQWLQHELNNPRPPLCLTCDTEFGPENYPATFSVTLPFANHV